MELQLVLYLGLVVGGRKACYICWLAGSVLLVKKRWKQVCRLAASLRGWVLLNIEFEGANPQLG